MSMGVSVKGLMPITDDYKKMLEIYKSCRELKIRPPKEIEDYSENDIEPCDEGIIVYLNDDIIERGIDSDRYYEFYDVKLPEGVTKIKFEMGW